MSVKSDSVKKKVIAAVKEANFNFLGTFLYYNFVLFLTCEALCATF